MTIDELILAISKKWHVRRGFKPNTISVIVSYRKELDDLAEKYDLILTEWANSALTVWGLFQTKL